jgi:hypothetical protein
MKVEKRQKKLTVKKQVLIKLSNDDLRETVGGMMAEQTDPGRC